MRKNIICIIQARLNSNRLPKKVLSDINGQPLILRILKRVARSKLISKTYVATGDQNNNKSLIDLINKKTKIPIYCGNDDNVLERYYKIALLEKPDIIAVSGYHGWHDWYIGTSTRDLGVPKKIKSLTKTFTFNDIHSFVKLTKKFPRKIKNEILNKKIILMFH